MYEFAVKREITMPIKTMLLHSYRYQSKNGEKGVQNTIFKLPSSRKPQYFLIKSAVSENNFLKR